MQFPDLGGVESRGHRWSTTLAAPLYTVFNPDGDNSVVCTNFTPAAGQTAPFSFDNRPPAGFTAMGGGLWKSFASCANDMGNQAPLLDELLASFPIASGRTTHGVYAGNLYVDSCAAAVDILDGLTSNGTKETNDPSYKLAAQLLVSELNLQAGAPSSACVWNYIGSANDLLSPVKDPAGNTGVDFAAAFNNNTAPKLTSSQTVIAKSTQSQLAAYNNNQPVQCPPATVF